MGGKKTRTREKERYNSRQRHVNKCGKQEWITEKEREGKQTVDQVETNTYTNRNKTEETHPSRTTLSNKPLLNN